jgi:hypothetical protein
VDIIKFVVAVCAELVHKKWIAQHYGITSVHIRDGIHWDPGRIDVCTKRIITMQKCTIFNRFKNKPH